MDLSFIVMWLGFILASYSVVGNDVIQTLGTFLTSNETRMKWWVMWAFGAIILTTALVNGYMMNDIDYGRLDKFDMPEVYHWYHLLPPLVLLTITRWGIPVSTTFMILTLFSLSAIPNDFHSMLSSVFDTDTKLGGMIQKSIMGYIIAFLSSIVIYLVITKWTERRFLDNPIKDDANVSKLTLVLVTLVMGAISYFIMFSDFDAAIRIGASAIIMAVIAIAGTMVNQEKFWTGFQWFTTGFLWYQWLTQDLANIYIYLRGGEGLSTIGFISSLAILLGLLAYIFYSKGGAVQKVVREKTNTADIRSATFVDLIYGVILYIFKDNYLGLFEAKMPMSTTWVFIGLLAGRELAIRIHLDKKVKKKVAQMIFADLGKVFFGLIVSVVLVFIIKMVAV